MELIEKLSLKDKVKLCSGADCWHTRDLSKYGLPAMMMCDGPHGLRCQKGKADMLGLNNSVPATCFPTASITACSWDCELLGRIGEAIALEAKAEGVGLVLGPGVNIKRDPLCGRNFEYFSEDPYLAGQLGAAYITKAQETGVGTTVKHFALNNQEYKRFNSDSQVDMRTMREIYLAPFETSVKDGKPDAVMCAYNKINGVHCSDSKALLTDILREEWGFDGLVVTDWGAMNDRIAATKAGCDLLMPGGSDYMQEDVLDSVKRGELTEAEIGKCALRVLRLLERSNALKPEAADLEKHHALARKAAAQSAVLLKNEDGILPLHTDSSIALIGAMADNPRYQGAGSSHINPTMLVSAKAAMPDAIYAPGCLDNGDTNENLLSEAAETAKNADVAIVFAGLTPIYESEGFDRENLQMPKGHIRLIEAVADANPNTVVVLSCGGVVECPWADRVKAILYMGLAGQAAGEATADLLYGRENPSGKLAETWVNTYSDCPTAENFQGRKNAQYRESIYVGYRYYDKAEMRVRFPFGYGLSYTQFSYSDLSIQDWVVTCTVKNIGDKAGREVVQLYIAPPQIGLHRPIKELRGFCKVSLVPGEAKEVSFALDDRAFSLWDDGWKTPGGEYGILICSDSRTVRLEGAIRIDGDIVPAPPWQAVSWYERPCGTPTQDQWEMLYGKAPESIPCIKGKFTMDHTVLEMRDQAWIMKFLHWCVELVISKPFGFKKDYNSPEFRMLMASSTDSPLRNVQMGGGIKGGLFKGMLHMANGHFFRGLFTILGIRK